MQIKNLKFYYSNKIEEYLTIKFNLIYINIITNVCYLFSDSFSLLSNVDLSKLDISNYINMKKVLIKCCSLSSLDGISKWDTFHFINMSFMF